jgi:WD40 repeat protein
MKTSRFPTALLLSLAALVSAPRPARAQFGQNKIAYDVFDWHVYRSTHFQLYFYTKEKASLEKVASFAESSYDELSRALNYQINHPIPLIFYATHAEFEQTNTMPSFIPEAVGAFALPSRDRMVLPIDMPDEQLQKLIQHELTHVFQFEILFQGNFLRAVTAPVPQWFTEGMASYYAKDEDNRARMVLRDAVISDVVPSIADPRLDGYFAYRFGHAVFDFVEAEWGRDAVRDLLYEYRTGLSGGIGKVIKRSFGLTVEDFDIRFRRYLRKRYLPILTTAGEPIDFGEKFTIEKSDSLEVSPAPFPSGEFVAAISTYKNDDADVVVLSAKDRKLFKNLSSGYTTRYEYVICQSLTTRWEGGRSVTVSPDGNLVAAFVRREKGRVLALFDVFAGKLAREIPLPVEQELSPTFSPDGKKIAFSAMSNGRSDIYEYSLEDGSLRDVTDDESYDTSPAYSPDGRWIYYSAVAGSFQKIFRVNATSPAIKEQVTFGDWNDDDCYVSPDGSRLYFSSDRNGGIYNIFSVDLKTGETWQHTDVIGGAFTPSVLPGRDGPPRLVFAAFYKRRFSLYLADAVKPYKKLASINPAPSAAAPPEAARYVPAIEVSLDEDKLQKKPSRKLYLDYASVNVGVNTDNTLLSDTTLILTDNLGDRQLVFNLQSISSFTNAHVSYVNIGRRFQWGVQLFDTRLYFLGFDTSTNRIVQDRRFLRQTGGALLASYPLDRYHRFDAQLGFMSRSQDTPYVYRNLEGNQVQQFLPRTDNAPFAGISFTGDTTLYSEVGPLAGHRYTIGYSYALDTKSSPELVGHQPDGTPIYSPHGGTLTSDVSVDFRQYFRITQRSTFAIRLAGFRSTGNLPTISYFGGLDTLRAYDYASEIGNELAYANFEYRFPLIDALRLPFLTLTNIRGRVFMDVGASRLTSDPSPWQFWNGSSGSVTRENPDGTTTTYRPYQLINGKADYGVGFSVGLLGVALHWDFARQWDFRQVHTPFRTSFYIGTEF